MPSMSKAQHNLMEMVAHDAQAAKRVGIPQSVGQDYSKADKGKKFKKGGVMKKDGAFKGKETAKEEEMEAKKMKKGGKCYKKGGAIDGIAQRGKTKGKVV